MPARRLKLTTILAGILLAGLALLSWTQDWFHVVVASPQGGDLPLDVAGDVAGLALFGALTIAGRVFRVVLGVLQVALGVSVVVTTATALADPVRASGSAVTTATGVDGTDSIRGIVSSVEPTAWPWLGLVAGVLAALLGVATVLLAGAWPQATRKYSATRLVAADPAADPAAAWDALSGGDDPTDAPSHLDEGGSSPTEPGRTR